LRIAHWKATAKHCNPGVVYALVIDTINVREEQNDRTPFYRKNKNNARKL